MNAATTFSPDRDLIIAVEEAADDDGWALASEIRAMYDGCEHAAGIWARRLHDHRDAGYLDCRDHGNGQFLWGLSEKGGELLYADA